jgi:hypothetical protein
MYGTREELCVQLENMFTSDEPGPPGLDGRGDKRGLP